MLLSALLLALYTLGVDAALRRFNFTLHSALRSPDGFEREVYLINDQQPGPLIDVDEGDDIEVFVQNDLDVPITMHWHGLLQRGTPDMDGVPGVTQKPIPAGGTFLYRFSTAGQYGFFWYHSHFRTYYNDAIRGPLLIRPAASRKRPFESLASSDEEKEALLNAERHAENIMLNDWTHELSDVIYARYEKTGAFPFCVDSILANGHGRVQCLPDSILRAGTDFMGAAMSDVSNASNMSNMSNMPARTPRGCTPPMMFKEGYDRSDLPQETCTNTTSDLLKISANETRGWVALNLVNAGAVSALSVSLDGHSMFIYDADGRYVDMQETQVLVTELGQRYSVMIKLDQEPGDYYLRFATYPSGEMQQVLQGKAIVSYSSQQDIPTPRLVDDESNNWMLLNGSAKADASMVDPHKLAPFEKADWVPTGAADKTMQFALNQTGILTWVINDAPYEEQDVPIIRGEESPGWNTDTTMHLPLNSTIDIILNIGNNSMDMMGHPLHLHGHKFWVLGSGQGDFPYSSVADAPDGVLNLENPPYRDTTGFPKKGWSVLRYVTDNPGAWIFHCHIQWHLVVGMAVVLVEGDEELASLVGKNNMTTVPGRSAATSVAEPIWTSWWILLAYFMVTMNV